VKTIGCILWPIPDFMAKKLKKQFKPLPVDIKLAPTLAGRLQQFRELRNMTLLDLATSSKMTLKRIEDLEQGLETWLSSPDRQIIAKAMEIEPILLQEVELRPEEAYEEPKYTSKDLDVLAEKILDGEIDLPCPACSKPLRCTIEEAYDLKERAVVYPKAFCRTCPFVLT